MGNDTANIENHNETSKHLTKKVTKCRVSFLVLSVFKGVNRCGNTPFPIDKDGTVESIDRHDGRMT